MLIAAILLCSVGCDQATKVFAARHLSGQGASSYLGDALRFHYVENSGAFLGLGADLPPALRFTAFVLLVAGLVMGALVYALRARHLDRAHVTALALIAAGGLGNLADRVRFGFVRDFLNVGLGDLRTGIFNLADVAITAGALWILLCWSRREDSVAKQATFGDSA